MQIKQLAQAKGLFWQQAIDLYCEVFPQWEREPVAEIAQAIDSGQSRCIILCNEDRVIGMSLTELYPRLSFALLGYLFIAPEHQGQGLGKRLCTELFDFFESRSDLKWLLVEAEAGPERFYENLGFHRLDVDYLSPHYDDMLSTPMALMLRTKPNHSQLSKQQLCDIVEHIFSESYYLTDDDPRLEQQRSLILTKEEL